MINSTEFNWMTNLIHQGAHKHAEKWGCIWNRDILDLCKQGFKNHLFSKEMKKINFEYQHIMNIGELHIVSNSSWHFGTTYILTAVPSKGFGLNMENWDEIIEHEKQREANDEIYEQSPLFTQSQVGGEEEEEKTGSK